MIKLSFALNVVEKKEKAKTKQNKKKKKEIQSNPEMVIEIVQDQEENAS